MTNENIIKELPNLKAHKSNLSTLKTQQQDLQKKTQELGKTVYALVDVSEVYEGCAIHTEDDGSVIYINAVCDENQRMAEVWKKEKKICYIQNGKVKHIGNFNAVGFGITNGKNWVAKSERPNNNNNKK